MRLHPAAACPGPRWAWPGALSCASRGVPRQPGAKHWEPGGVGGPGQDTVPPADLGKVAAASQVGPLTARWGGDMGLQPRRGPTALDCEDHLTALIFAWILQLYY